MADNIVNKKSQPASTSSGEKKVQQPSTIVAVSKIPTDLPPTNQKNIPVTENGRVVGTAEVTEDGKVTMTIDEQSATASKILNPPLSSTDPIILSPENPVTEKIDEPSPTEVKHAIWRAKIHLMNLTDELQLVLQTQKLSPLLRQVAAEQRCTMPGNADDWQPLKIIKGVIDKMPKDMTEILIK